MSIAGALLQTCGVQQLEACPARSLHRATNASHQVIFPGFGLRIQVRKILRPLPQAHRLRQTCILCSLATSTNVLPRARAWRIRSAKKWCMSKICPRLYVTPVLSLLCPSDRCVCVCVHKNASCNVISIIQCYDDQIKQSQTLPFRKR